MRSTYPFSIFLLPVTALQIPSIFIDFYAPQDSLLLNETSIPNDDGHDLLKRDGNCPDNFNSCSTYAKGNGGACCTVGSVCTKDSGNNIACCPIGAKCTGSVTAGSGTAAGGAVFGSPTTTGTGTSTSSNTATITSGSGTASYVQNTFFPFPYIPTTYSNSAACNTAYSACQANLAACTNALGGNAFGVTVVAPGGGGVTVTPTAANVGSASASSVCESLSSEACYNIQSGNCAQFGTGSGGQFVVATKTNMGATARQTGKCMAAAGILAGLGIAGGIM